MKRDFITIVLIIFLVIGFIPLMGFIQLKNQIRSLEMEIQILKDGQAMMSYNQKRLIEAVTSWLEVWQVDMFEASAYSPLDDRNGLNSNGNPELMATMAKTRDHIDTAIAVDPSVIPLHSTVWIQGEGFKKALDTGGAIKGKKIDICMRSFDDAIRFGRQNVLVVYPKKGG